MFLFLLKYRKYFLSTIWLFLPAAIFAAVMESGNYKIQADSINLGGGLGTSSSYMLESTVGEVGTGLSTSTSYLLNAGYQAMQSNYISITNSADVILPNGSISGISGGTAQGSSVWTVVTDDPAGYQMTVQTLTSPALKATSTSFTDYVPTAGANPDYTFFVGPASSTFAFSPEGVDIVSRYKDDNSALCNTGSNDNPGTCWDGLSTTPRIIAQSSSANHPIGTNTTIKYQAGIGNSKIQEPGTYISTVTVTAIAL